MESLSVVIKCMLKAFDCFKYMLVAAYEKMNFELAISIKTRVTQVIAEALIYKFICIFGPSRLLIEEKDSAFTGEVIQFILKTM